MKPRTLNARLTCAAVLAVIVAVLCLIVGARWIVDHQMRSSLDDSLRRRATDVARLSVSAPAVLSAPGALEAPVSGRQLTVEVHDRHGVILARSLALGAKLLPASSIVTAALRQGRAEYADVRLDREPIRMFAAPVPEAGGPAAGGVVLVASSTSDIERTMHRLTGLLLLCGLLAAVIGAVAAAYFTRRGLRPIARLSSSAAAIERTGDAAARLPDPATSDEVGELARTLNRMLEALAAARGRERRFLADASHELRTPLTSLAGNVDFLVRHGLNEEVLADLEHDTVRLRRLVADLLELEREDGAAAPEQRVPLDAIVAAAATEHPEVRVAERAPVTVLGDADALRRALDNLLENARVHGPSGGEVTVSLSVEGHTAHLSVADEGPGLSPAEAAHAFERFWRGAQAPGRPGSGLGLAIVRATAKRHGGTVVAEGSTITVSLPAAAVHSGQAADPLAR